MLQLLISQFLSLDLSTTQKAFWQLSYSTKSDTLTNLIIWFGYSLAIYIPVDSQKSQFIPPESQVSYKIKYTSNRRLFKDLTVVVWILGCLPALMSPKSRKIIHSLELFVLFYVRCKNKTHHSTTLPSPSGGSPEPSCLRWANYSLVFALFTFSPRTRTEITQNNRLCLTGPNMCCVFMCCTCCVWRFTPDPSHEFHALCFISVSQYCVQSEFRSIVFYLSMLTKQPTAD